MDPAAVPENEVEKIQLLPAASEDEHGGVLVEMEQPMEPQCFRANLIYSLSQWKLQGKKGVWIKLPAKLTNLLEIAIKEGFQYHHAEIDFLMLVYWFPHTQTAIPSNETHRVRIGAIVVNNKNELLVVVEKHGRFKGRGFWKIPTGIVDKGEDIFDGSRREVKEETGIDTEFVGVLAFSQVHKAFFKKSDLFVICMLRPLSFDIQTQASEIEAAQWMPISEYAAQPLAQQHPIFKYVRDICLANVDKGYTGFTPVQVTSDEKISYLYVNQQDLDFDQYVDQDNNC